MRPFFYILVIRPKHSRNKRIVSFLKPLSHRDGHNLFRRGRKKRHRDPEARNPEARNPEARNPEGRSSEVRTSEGQEGISDLWSLASGLWPLCSL